MRHILMFLIRVYQRCLSPFFPSSCRFYPSCSEFALQAFQVHGAGKGFILTIIRLLKCHPLCRGGVDPVPPKSGGSTS
ncbi:MAG: membrane protein insertion efficiency factor YidD [Desulfovibrionales bacterium]